ncbi:GH32 C-terminal domain-containing protein [Piscirickettsia litoralis]|uniref:Glycosyl hydrolase family 32 C-terminal domain-containing protein n=1 Tax=Piscirickettsia litoralis TaxID=1891921 RepID=A0ABX3A0V6_9GAMM|nr:GH32 C-terminal domain-containing protein [Piscirickettsia litoralis]ODN42105.1 hypothetical protein BGC07_03005 [Piscirickettsia litoralis]
MKISSGSHVILNIRWIGSRIILNNNKKTCMSEQVCDLHRKRKINARLFFDTSSVEVFVDDGTVCGSLRLEPPEKREITIRITTKLSQSFSGKLWELNSIWSNKVDA